VILEAQASGLPVVAVDQGGPASLVSTGETGLLAPPEANLLADAVLSLVGSSLLAERVRRAALAAVRGRTWESALEQLAAGYRVALEQGASSEARSVA
jgi:glycosyltransferase involved in cell wall biosynthesis